MQNDVETQDEMIALCGLETFLPHSTWYKWTHSLQSAQKWCHRLSTIWNCKFTTTSKMAYNEQAYTKLHCVKREPSSTRCIVQCTSALKVTLNTHNSLEHEYEIPTQATPW